jgi:hypothetical protein
MSNNVAASKAWLELSPTVAMVPVEHGLLAYADEVRRAVMDYQPTCLAVELPQVLDQQITDMVQSLPEIKLLSWLASGNKPLMLAIDPCDARIEAIRLADEHQVHLEYIDQCAGNTETPLLQLPDEFAVTELGVRLFTEKIFEHLPHRKTTERETILAARLNALGKKFNRVLYIGDIASYPVISDLLKDREALDKTQFPDIEEMPDILVTPIAEQSLDRVLREIPYTVWLYENFRNAHGPEDRFPVMDAQRKILRKTADAYSREFDEEVNMTEWKGIFQYARNLAITRNQLRPQFYELMMAAKGCVDDDFAAIFFEKANKYPPNALANPDQAQGRSNRHESLGLYGEFNGQKERLIHAYPFPKLEEIAYSLRRRRPNELEDFLWRENFKRRIFDGDSICSWPPEDAFVENFFQTVRHRAYQQITSEHSSTEEFTSSIMDGLDIRETLRNWHQKKLMVKKERVPPGKVGPVVVIWRDFPAGFANLWRTTLYAEHDAESDIAFYSTPLGRDMVGPGITRTEYHGIVSIFPPRSILDPWIVGPLYKWRTCARMMIASAILLAQERYIAVVAPKPPDIELQTFARKNKKALIYLPMGQFSKSLLKKARQSHILASHKIRAWASDYINPR